MWKDKKASKPVVAVSTKDVAVSVDVVTKMGTTVLKPSIITIRTDELSSGGKGFLHGYLKYHK